MTRANAATRRASRARAEQLADFVVAPRVIFIAALAAAVGVMSAFVAWGLLRLIGLFTNIFFFQRWGTALVSPADNRLGALEIVVPVAGALIIGLMARYGSERIRGHGIPEALEAILIGDSRMSPRVAVLKPLSSAISIGSGGPFGAEGPIIMTGGRSAQSSASSSISRAPSGVRCWWRARPAACRRRSRRRSPRYCSRSSCCCSNGGRAA